MCLITTTTLKNCHAVFTNYHICLSHIENTRAQLDDEPCANITRQSRLMRTEKCECKVKNQGGVCKKMMEKSYGRDGSSWTFEKKGREVEMDDPDETESEETGYYDVDEDFEVKKEDSPPPPAQETKRRKLGREDANLADPASKSTSGTKSSSTRSTRESRRDGGDRRQWQRRAAQEYERLRQKMLEDLSTQGEASVKKEKTKTEEGGDIDMDGIPEMGA